MSNPLGITNPVQMTELPPLLLHLFDTLPGICVLVKADRPRYTIVAVTEGLLQAQTTMTTKEDLIGKSFFEPWRDNPASKEGSAQSSLRASLDYVVTHKAEHHLPTQRYDLPNGDGSFTERHWAATNKPVGVANGEVEYILHTSTDITNSVKVEQQEKEMKGMEQAHSLFMQSPISIHMVKGHDLIIEMANKPTLDYWGRGTEIIGKPLLEALPELEGQGFDVLLREVLQTGETKEFYETPVVLHRHGKKEAGYFNFIYKPYYEEGNPEPVGIITVSTEVTDKVLAKKDLAENKQRLELAVEIAELADFRIDVATQVATYSQQAMGWFAMDTLQGTMEEISSRVHSDDRPFVLETLERSVAGEWDGRHDITYRLPQKNGDLLYLRSIGQVQFIDGKPVAIFGIIQNVTDNVLTQLHIAENQKQLLASFNDSPVGLAIITGDELRFSMANSFYGRLAGRPPEELVGKTLLQALPELEGQGFDVLLRQVMATGKPFVAKEAPVHLLHNGKPEIIYIDHTYQPQRDASGAVTGVLVVVIDITQQVLTRKKIEESEAKLRSIIAAAPPAIGLFIGRDLVVQMPNKTFIDIVGKGSDIEGKPLREVMPELVTENQPFLQILDDVYTSGIMFQTYGAQVKILQRGVMTENYYNITYSPLFDTEGKVYGILDVAVDVTGEVMARKALEESEVRFRSLIEEAPVATCLFTGRNLMVEVANPTILSYWGKGNAPLGKPLAEALPELEGQSFLQILDEVFTSGKTYEAKAALAQLQINGELRDYYFDFTYKPLRKATGEVYGIMNMAVDVTAEVKAIKALEESERNLRNMILQSPIAMAILKGDNFVVEIANERMFELWGRQKETLLGKPIFDVMPEVKGQGYEAILHTVFTTGERFSAQGISVNLPRSNGMETVYIDLLYEAYKESDGSVSGIIAVATDVTQQVLARQKIEEIVAQRTKELAEANEAMRLTNQELQRSNANLEEFAHAASHDLKEPIRKIHYFTQHLKEQLGSGLNEPEARAFSRIENATERMGNLIDDLLLYSHVSQRPHETEPVDLSEKLKRVMEDLELDIGEKKAVINAGKLPVVQGYRRQLQQLFQNLLSNALKYTKAGEAPRIDISATEVTEAGQRYHLITVKDNGIGFEQQYADKIFQMFARLHGKNEYSGTGVGLSIVKKVVENHNGFIRVESEAGKGSTFFVYLPAE